MRILVATTVSPFGSEARGDAAERLVAAIREHRPRDAVDLVRLPRGPGLPLAARLTDVSPVTDRLIALDEDAALLPHPQRRLWLDHGSRELLAAPVTASAWAVVVDRLVS